MHLHNWRPQGAGIAPLPVRRRMGAEARQEVEGYGHG